MLVGVLLIAATTVVYVRVARFGFVNLDDPTYVFANPRIQEGLTPSGILWALTSLETHWHPLTRLSWMLDAQIGGASPHVYHVTNLLLHMANVLLLFVVLDRMTGAMWRSGFVAGLFAVHPVHVESVAWITERRDVLSTLFWILTMLTYCRYVDAPGTKRYLALASVFTLGLMSKSMLVTLPAVLLLLDFWPLERHARPNGKTRPGAGRSRGLVLEKAPLFVLSAATAVVTFAAQRLGGAVASSEFYPLLARFENAVVAYSVYLGMLVWPRNLAILYPHPGASLPALRIAGAGFLLLALSALALYQARRRPYLLVGWLWYLVTLVPVIGLIQVGDQAMADRYAYVPFIGLYIVVAWGLPDLVARIASRGRSSAAAPLDRPLNRLLAASGTVALVALAACAFVQAGHWRNSLALFQHAVDASPKNALAHNMLGGEFKDRGRLEEAISHFSEAVRLDPLLPDPICDLGGALIKVGRLEEGIAVCRRTLAQWPPLARPHADLGLGLMRLANRDEARARQGAAPAAPGDAGSEPLDPAVAEKLKRLREEGIAHLEQALRLDPSFADAHFNLGVALAEQRRFEEAIEQFQEVLRIRPSDRDAPAMIGLARERLGKRG